MTNITSLLRKNQEVIDAATKTIAATRKTQNVLELNIKQTDQKIESHNTNLECHEDIRVKLEDMPAMIGDPVVSGPSATETGEENRWTLSAVPVIPTVKVLSFEVTDHNGEVFTVNADDSGSAEFVHTFVGNRNQQIEIAVQAKGSYEFCSKKIMYPLLITQHLPPSFESLQHTLPTIISHGKRYNFSVSGITDLDNDLSAVHVRSSNPKVTFNQSENLTQGLNYELIVASDYAGPDTCIITIRAEDAYGLSNEHQVAIPVNADPNVQNFASNIPLYLNKGSSIQARVSNVTDHEGKEVSFSIQSNDGRITFSKSENILVNEDFIINVSDEITQNTPYTLTFIFRDPDGGETTKTISSKINTPPSVSAFKATTENRYVIGKEGTISFAGSTDANGETVTYEIENPYSEIVFSKTKNIGEGEIVAVTFLPEATHGATYQVKVYSVDTSGAKVPVTVVLMLNALPTTDNLITNIPTHVAPGKEYTFHIDGSTDADGHPITYNVTSPNEDVVLQNSTNMAGGQEFSCRVPTEEQLPRNSLFTLVLTLSDTLESTTKTFNIRQNMLPVLDDMTVSFPNRIIPGGSYNLVCSGASDPDGHELKYSVEGYDESVFTFTKTENISDGEIVPFTISSTCPRGVDYSFTIRVTDTVGESVTAEYSTKCNTLPDIQSAEINLPPIVVPGQTYKGIVLSGITDIDEDTLTCTVTANNWVEIIDGKNIPIDSSFTVTIPEESSLERGNTFNVNVAVSDGYEQITKDFTFKVNTLPDLTKMVISLIPKVVPKTEYEVTVSGATETDAQTLLHTITCSHNGTVQNGNEIKANAPFRITTPGLENIQRGEEFTVTVAVSDGLETVEKTFTHLINQLPSSEIEHTFLKVVVPGRTYEVSVNTTDPDKSDELTYKLTSLNENVVLPTEPIAIGGTAEITVPTEEQLARGETFVIDIEISDGFESIHKEVTIAQNLLPSAAKLTSMEPLPEVVYGGIENSITFKLVGNEDTDESLHVAPATFSIVDASKGLAFSKTEGILPKEEISVYGTKVTKETEMTFNAIVVDELQESSPDKASFSLMFHPIIVTEAPTISYPTDGDRYVPYKEGFTMTWSKYSSMVWTGEGVYPRDKEE